MLFRSGAGPGAHKITRDVTQVMAELPAVVEALTGKSFEEITKRIPGVQNGEHHGTDAGAAVADAEAEEIR